MYCSRVGRQVQFSTFRLVINNIFFMSNEKLKCYQMLHGIGVMLLIKTLFLSWFLGGKDTECSCANLLSMPLFNQSCGSHSWKTSFNNILPVFYHLQSKLKSHTWKTSFNNILLLFYRLMPTFHQRDILEKFPFPIFRLYSIAGLLRTWQNWHQSSKKVNLIFSFFLLL